MTIPPRAKNMPPFIGNLFGFALSPNTFLLNLVEKYGDVVNFDLVGANTYLIAQPEALHDVLIRKKKSFTKSMRSRRILGMTMGTGLVTSVDDYHARQRRLVQPAFHTHRLQRYIDTMVDLANNRVEQWQNGSVHDIHSEMMSLTMEVVSKTLFGGDVAEDTLTVGHAIETLQKDGNDRLTNPVATVMRKYFKVGKKETEEARETVNRLVMRFIADRRAQGAPDTGDLLSMLLLSTDENGDHMTDKEVRDEAVTLFAAGHETTSNFLTWTWYILSQNPDMKQKLHDEIKTVLGDRRPTLEDLRNLTYTNMLLKEVLRYYPPAWIMVARTCVEDVEVGGYKIPDGANILIAPYTMHRNPRYWDNVHTFDPERFTPENEKRLHRYQYIPFGAGEHICIGNMFSLMEAQLVLVTIASRFDLELAMPAPVTEKALVTLLPRGGLKMYTNFRD